MTHLPDIRQTLDQYEPKTGLDIAFIQDLVSAGSPWTRILEDEGGHGPAYHASVPHLNDGAEYHVIAASNREWNGHFMARNFWEVLVCSQNGDLLARYRENHPRLERKETPILDLFNTIENQYFLQRSQQSSTPPL